MKTILFFLLLGTVAFAEMEMPPPLHYNADQSRQIIVNNRILAKVNGETISLMDVVKKMDMLFFRQYPEYANAPELRFQYYMVNWKAMLSSVIDDRLVKEDAKEKKVEVTDGDVREMMEQLFGPDVVMSLDKVGLTYAEARELVKTELIVRQMSGMMVRSKAQFEVNPKEVKKLYEQIAKSAPLDEKWVYRMLTIAAKEEEKAKKVADEALKFAEKNVAFEMLPSLLKKENEGIDCRVSEEYRRTDKELSSQHKTVLESLGMGACSTPVVQLSKKGDEYLVRIFHLQGKEKGKETTLKDLEEKLNGELLEKAFERNQVAYIEKLRKHYGMTENYLETMVPEGFTPFALR